MSRESVVHRLAAPPFVADTPAAEDNRRRGVRIVLDWLATQRPQLQRDESDDNPGGGTWQQRWLAGGAEDDGRVDWRGLPILTRLSLCTRTRF